MPEVDDHDGWLEKPIDFCALKIIGIESRYKQLARLTWNITKVKKG